MFELASGGVLSFKEGKNHEMPTDANRDNVYELTVRASDGTLNEDRMVMVTVTDEDEGPEITGVDSVSYAENGEGAVATFTATDPEGGSTITWSFAADGSDSIEGDRPRTDVADVDGETSTIRRGRRPHLRHWQRYRRPRTSSVSPDFEIPPG